MENNYFEESDWASLRAFNNGQETGMLSEPIPADINGNYTCLPADEESGDSHNRVWQIGFEWEQSRDIRGINITFADETDGTLIKEQYIQYWMNVWPTPTQEHRAGALRGWAATEDPFHGHWAEAYGDIKLEKNGSRTLFDHIDITEVSGGSLWAPGGDIFSSDDFNAYFRRTLKLRVLFVSEKPPVISGFSVIGNCSVTDRECEIYTNVFKDAEGVTLAKNGLSIWNGTLTEILDTGKCIQLKYTAVQNPACDGDMTLLTLDCGNSYPFSVKDRDIQSGVYMQEYDLLITPPLNGKSPDEAVKELKSGHLSIFDRVPEHAEQTTENAFAEIPEMDVTKQQPYGRYVVLGWDGLRKKFLLRYNGDIFADKGLQKSARRDLCGTRWAGGMLHFRISSGDPPSRREAKGDCRQHMPDAAVPFYVTEWLDREIEYTQSSFAVPRDTSLIGKDDLRGDEDILVMNRVVIRNTSDDTHISRLYIEPLPAESLEIHGKHLVAVGRVMPDDTVAYGWRVHNYDTPLMRLTASCERGELKCVPRADGNVTYSMRPGEFLIKSYYDGRRAEFTAPSTINTSLLYEVSLGAYETVTFDFTVPYNTPTDTAEMDEVASYDFDGQKENLTAFWKAFSDKSAHLSLPGEKHLNDFAKAVPWHIIMTAMREPVSGNYIVPAGTYTYEACGNEACMQIRLMDYLGYHDYAEKYLQTYVNSQGMNGLDGNFKTKEGAFFAINYGGRGSNDDQFSYNLDHGYILSCFADHYFLTGDNEWLRRVADSLCDGCDFVFREREATKITDANGEKVSYYGLLPHGHLEDNNEWRCWFAVNAHACGGILRVAEALAQINDRRAEEIKSKAEEYRDDIRAALLYAVRRSYAVPDGRGGFIPHVPTHAEIRGRDLGWFREAAYGPLHLVYGMILDPNEPLTTWILRDLEDNLFISRNYGRIADREKYWFSRGGITIQSNLLFNDLVYLQRNEPKRALRALFNNFAQNLYRDMNCFTEHPVPEFGHGIGPFFKTPDESQFLVFLRNHLLREEDGKLLLLQGASEGWFDSGKTISFDGMATFYGPVSLECVSSEREITITVTAKWREAPSALRLFVRRGSEAPACVRINGKYPPRSMLRGGEIVIPSPDEKLEIIVTYE